MGTLSRPGPLERLTDAVYCLAADTHRVDRPRRMTLFRLPSGALVVHGGVRLQDADMAEIDALGPVAYYLLVPNPHHDPDRAWFAGRYPTACFLAPRAEAARLRAELRVDGTFEDDWPPELGPLFRHHTVGGTRFTETVFLHVPSRTLTVVDLAFNVPRSSLEGRPFDRLFMQLNNACDRFGMTRLTEMLVQDPAALRRSLEEILSWDFDRVIVSHGAVVEADGKRLFRAGFPRYLPPV